MDNIYSIKYTDAYYSYDKNIQNTKLSLYEAYGYVEKVKDNFVVLFIKEKGISAKKTINENRKIIRGLIIPDRALVTTDYSSGNTNKFRDITEGMFLSVTWRDIVYIANIERYDCSTMQTKGVLGKVKDGHIVIIDPETTRIYPSPLKKHPTKKPNYYVIPKCFITDISIVK